MQQRSCSAVCSRSHPSTRVAHFQPSRRAVAAAAIIKPHNAAAVQPVPPDVLHVEQSHGHWHRGVHYVVMEVRDYELDQFQVVNNAVYASYIQHGRHQALKSLNMPVEQFQAQGTLMALSDLSLQYKAPLRAGDTFYVTTAVAQVTPARVVIHHTVQQVSGHQSDSNDKPQVVCQAQATVVFLDQKYRPVRVPQDAREVLSQLQAEYQSGS